MRASTFVAGRTIAGAALAVALLLAPRPAAAEGQLGGSPWFPLVDPEVGPQETFELNTLDIIRTGSEGWRPNRGKYRSLLSRHDFYVTVGRTDLANADAASAAVSRVLLWSGCASVAVGAILFYAHVSSGGIDPGLKPGLIFAGAGVAGLLLSGTFTGPSVAPEEAEEMARRYNERLKANLEQEDSKPKPLQVFVPRVLPWTDGHSGGGLMALAVF